MNEEGEPILFYPNKVPKLKVDQTINDLPILGLPLFTTQGRKH